MKGSTRESICMLCGKRKDGIEIKSDYVIESIRWFKRAVLKAQGNNRVVVCSSCYPTYKAQRKKYKSRQMTYVVLGFLFMLCTIVIAKDILAVLVGIVLLAVLYLVSLLNYVPDLSYRKDTDGG